MMVTEAPLYSESSDDFSDYEMASKSGQEEDEMQVLLSADKEEPSYEALLDDQHTESVSPKDNNLSQLD